MASCVSRVLRRFPRKASNYSIRESRKPLSVFMLTRQTSSDTKSSPAENAITANWKCRQDLATAFRGLDWYGLSEGVCTHLTMMAPGMKGDGDVMLMIPHGLHWSQECWRKRCLTCTIRHCRFFNDFAYDSNFEGAAKDCTEGERLAKLIGNKSVLFMANHGVLFTGPTAAIAFDNAYYMERACMLQTIAMQTGKKLRKLSNHISMLTYKQTKNNLEYYANSHFEAIKAVLLQKDPGFLNR